MQTKEKETMKLLVLDFDSRIFLYKFTIVELEGRDGSPSLDDYYKIIGCNTVDFTDYTKEITIIVDDEGLFKENTFYSEIIAPDGLKMQLAGRLIFAKNIYTDDGIKTSGLSAGECFELLTSLKIKLLGVRA